MRISRLSGVLYVSFYLMLGFIPPGYSIGVTGQGMWETTPQVRDFDGVLVVYGVRAQYQ